jgi:hypothetical protein
VLYGIHLSIISPLFLFDNVNLSQWYHLLLLLSGYLTNTGIKFMLVIENVQLNEDGISFDTSAPFTFLHSSSLYRESDLKNMFVRDENFFTLLFVCVMPADGTNISYL